jgi:lysozyme
MTRLDSIIDLSHHEQQTIDFAKVKAAGIVAVMHKATEGNYMQDRFYLTRRDDAKTNGLLWGAFHFGAQGIAGKVQAKYFLKYVGNLDGDFVCLDFETYSKRHDSKVYCMTLSDAKDFISAVSDKIGRLPFFYSGNTISEKLGKKKDPRLGACKLWLAGYVAEKKLKVQPSWADWTLWQYTDGTGGPMHRPVDGVGPCDRSVFDGDLAALKAVWAK